MHKMAFAHVFGPEKKTDLVHFRISFSYAALMHYTRLFPDPRFLLFVLQIFPVTKMRLNICFNEMALFGLFAALIKGCSSYGRNGGQSTRGDG